MKNYITILKLVAPLLFPILIGIFVNVYWFMHPELTQMELFIKFWFLSLLALVSAAFFFIRVNRNN
jgi:hypothetical protein